MLYELPTPTQYHLTLAQELLHTQPSNDITVVCRQEGFPSTAEVIAKRLENLGGAIANGETASRCAPEDEKASLYDMLRWTVRACLDMV